MTSSLRPIATCALAVLLLAAPPLWAQRGGVTIPQDLEEMTREAHTIVRGHILQTRAERHPQLTNLDTILITVRVSDTLKGETGETFTFRQYVWDIRDTYDHAGYKKGQEVLLLLSRPSEIGFSSPIGLQQGRFHIERVEGRARALNGHGNAMLFERLRQRPERLAGAPQRLRQLVQEHRRGPVELEDLEALIRRLARAEE